MKQMLQQVKSEYLLMPSLFSEERKIKMIHFKENSLKGHLDVLIKKNKSF